MYKLIILLFAFCSVIGCTSIERGGMPVALSVVEEGVLEGFFSIKELKSIYDIENEVEMSCLLPTYGKLVQAQECELKWMDDKTAKYAGIKISQQVFRDTSTFFQQLRRYESLTKNPETGNHYKRIEVAPDLNAFLYVPDAQIIVMGSDSISFSMLHSRRLFNTAVSREIYIAKAQTLIQRLFSEK